MEKLLIGNILRERMRKCGYTYETFAEEIGINESTIKRYAYGKRAYSYEHLIKFAEALNCSYDYLLGYSCSPEREYHEIKELTMLSDESIDTLCKWAKGAENDSFYEYIYDVLNEIICHKEFLADMLIYCTTNKVTMNMGSGIIEAMMKKNGFDTKSDTAKDYLRRIEEKSKIMSLMTDIEEIKYKMSPELLDDMRNDIKRVNKSISQE